MRDVLPALFLIVLGLCGCGKASSPSNTDPFYTDKGGWDYARLPLLKPYEVWYLNDHYGLLRGDGHVLVQNLVALGVDGEFAYGKAGSQDIEAGGKVYKGTNIGDWFCLNLKGGKLAWYRSEEELSAFLSVKLSHKPDRAVAIQTLFQEFQQKGVCKWFP